MYSLDEVKRARVRGHNQCAFDEQKQLKLLLDRVTKTMSLEEREKACKGMDQVMSAVSDKLGRKVAEVMSVGSYKELEALTW